MVDSKAKALLQKLITWTAERERERLCN